MEGVLHTAWVVLTFFLNYIALGFFAVMFAMNVGVILTWADRRQGAMIQDRVGPNRAGIPMPTKVAQGAILAPALGVAGAVVAYLLQFKAEGPELTQRALLFSQLAILWTWLTGLMIAGGIRKRGVRNSFDEFIKGFGDPRVFFYAGLGLHLVSVLVFLTLRGTDTGRWLRDVGYKFGSLWFVVVVVFGAGYTAYAIRKQPNIRLRLAGLLHPAADGLKTLFKEDFIPPNADRFLHSIAPVISFFPALVTLAVVPFGDTLCFGLDAQHHLDYSQMLANVPREGVCVAGAKPLQVLDLNVGILYFFAIAGTGIVGAALAGWASDNKYSLLGGLRAASQMVSYEVTLGLTLIGAMMVYGTLRVDRMVQWQAENAWGIFVQPLAFFLFFTAAVAESKRIPFDIPEGESEIVAGYYTEYAGMKFAMFFFAEYIAVVSSSALMAAIFLGGWHLPFVFRDGIEITVGNTVVLKQALPHGLVILLGFLGFIGKTIGLCFVQLTIRWTLPRFRYDQLMRLGWRKLLPASIVNILVTGLVMLAIDSASADVKAGLEIAAKLSMLLIAVLGLVGIVALVVFMLQPASKRKLLVSSSARFATMMGGTRTARMGA